MGIRRSDDSSALHKRRSDVLESLSPEPLEAVIPILSNILIRGDGVAALCCAHLLRNAGFQVAMERQERSNVPAIMLSDAALALIRDVFGQPDLFSSATRITRRVVCWGRDSEVIEMPHAGIVLSGAQLLEAVGWGLDAAPLASADFIIHASRPLPAVTEEHRFGSRSAFAAGVNFKHKADASSCWIESLEGGWLFLIPEASDTGWLVGVGAPLQSLIATSRVIAPRIDLAETHSGEFPACPKITVPLAAPGWIACGTSAIAFDPICGDGTAQAVREAILASAVIRGIAQREDMSSLFAHYETRLLGAMLRHLELCAGFYRDGGQGRWWSTEEGQRWCAARLRDAAEPRYRLNGFVLEALEARPAPR